MHKSKLVKDVQNVEEFMEKYYKHERYRGAGAEYAEILLQSHQKDFEKDGYDLISHYDSVTGEMVLFGNPPFWWNKGE
jgi:exopolyphosphatase/pppGpp-phosphohydrolase